MELSIDLSYLHSMKVMLTGWKLNYVDCVSFFVLILSMLFTIKSTNLKKSYSWIFGNYDWPSTNFGNAFNFIGQFSNYVDFEEIPLLNILHINL